MPTLVCFHAHPDDETLGTGGTMALAADAGHRVVLVVATRGERGEIRPGVLDEGEQLALRRSAETHASATELGVDRIEFLGYVDSGMMGEATNDEPWTFWQADVDAAARRLAVILAEEQADTLTIYDDNGGYGHPDHIQVHRVGRRAAELAGTTRMVESTMNRDHLRRGIEAVRAELPPDAPELADLPDIGDDSGFGKPEAELTHVVDVTDALDRKRRALSAHASQVGEEHFMLAMAPKAFAHAFGTEWYIGHGPVGDEGCPLRNLLTPLA